MFGWLRRKGPETPAAPVERKAGPRKRKPKPAGHTEMHESDGIVQRGGLILKQQTTTQEGTDRIFIQPVKLEIPNMVTIGGKLDMILDELEKKPDREWFQADYIETLKSVLKLTSEAAATSEPAPGAEKMAQAIGMIQDEVSVALILETLKVKGPLSMTDLSKHTGVSRVTVWRDLKKLSKEGKVRLKREGRFKVACLK